MSRRTLAAIVACTVLAIGLVVWLGDEYRNEAHAFLRASLRALLRAL
jgi:hypothetical protein